MGPELGNLPGRYLERYYLGKVYKREQIVAIYWDARGALSEPKRLKLLLSVSAVLKQPQKRRF